MVRGQAHNKEMEAEMHNKVPSNEVLYGDGQRIYGQDPRSRGHSGMMQHHVARRSLVDPVNELDLSDVLMKVAGSCPSTRPSEGLSRNLSWPD